MSSPKFSAQDVLTFFGAKNLNDSQLNYLKEQAERLAYTRNLVQSYCTNRNESARILDVGQHFLTVLIAETLTPQPIVSTIGHPNAELVDRKTIHAHHTLDLNRCGDSERPFGSTSFDIITFCEVVEHLYIPPYVVLTFLKQLLAGDGKLILGTPNAASLTKRIRMLIGDNPFAELVPDNRYGLIHIREYTMAELVRDGARAGLKASFTEYCNYWVPRYLIGTPQLVEAERSIPSFRGGLTVVYQIDPSEAR
jgi:2-polyprenyl-3-methyl-5-hydroxy-6-metoxy-1,4-benzoquinol methylase